MYGFLLLLLSLYYLFNFFFFLFASNYTVFLLFRAVYSRRSPHTVVAAVVTDDVSAGYTYIYRPLPP